MLFSPLTALEGYMRANDALMKVELNTLKKIVNKKSFLIIQC